MRAIYKRELTSYFHSMIGCVFVAFLIAFTGVYFIAYNVNYGYPYFSYVLSGILFVDLIAIPILTMRSFAEERKNKTDQMLLTSPVGLFQIVMGKYLAMVTVLAIPCTIYLLFPLMIKAQGTAYIWNTAGSAPVERPSGVYLLCRMGKCNWNSTDSLMSGMCSMAYDKKYHH